MPEDQTQTTDEVQEAYPIKLSWQKTWILITMGLSLVGGIFATGMKVQNELNKVSMAKMEQKYQEDVTALKCTIGRELREAQEDMTFYKNQYRVVSKRLETCINKGTFVDAFIPGREPK